MSRLNPVYIKGLSALSPQPTFQQHALPAEPVVYNQNKMQATDPAWKDYLDPVMARRMGRIIKMGIASATEALRDAKVEMPGAIITGTALGCMGDTEKFLISMIRDEEQFLTPTWFIQSLQNTVSAQIALHFKCTHHNFTFAHKGFSFESALLDGMMMLHEQESDQLLIGGIDEMTENNFLLYDRLGKWKKEKVSSNRLLHHQSAGTIAGEGAVFFVAGRYPGENDYAILREVRTIYNPADPGKVADAIHQLMKDQNMSTDDLSMILWGFNGDEQGDAFLGGIRNLLPDHIASGYFKHLCGEYQTSSSFALWLAAMMLKSETVPHYVFTENPIDIQPEKLLICNHYENNFSLILVTGKNPL